MARVLVVTMFETLAEEGSGETFRWLSRRPLDRVLPVPGFDPQFPSVAGSDAGLWVLTTGVGEANASATITALALSGVLDLSRAYILIAGIAGITPHHGTLGDAVWADFAVNGGLAHELDARDLPDGWDHGFVPLGATHPDQPPALRIPGDVIELNPVLCKTAYKLTKDVTLTDSPAAKQSRARYPQLAAQADPRVSIGTTLTQNTFWSGPRLSRRADSWVKQFTEGRGTYVTAQMEDNGTLTAVARMSAAGLLSADRAAVLRCGSNFDQPAPGQRPDEGFGDESSWAVAAENAYRVGSAFADHVLANWSDWQNGIPAQTLMAESDTR
jgi:purine nucleoside permease